MRKFTQPDKTVNLEFQDVDNRLTAVEKDNPIGVIKLWAGVEPPIGYIWCDGVEYAIEEYPQLFRVMEFRGGTPSGSGKFKVPNITVGNFRYIVKAR